MRFATAAAILALCASFESMYATTRAFGGVARHRNIFAATRVSRVVVASPSTTSTNINDRSINNRDMNMSMNRGRSLFQVRGGSSISNNNNNSGPRTGTTGTTGTALNSALATQETERASTPTEYFRKDYIPLPHTVSNIQMDFDIRDGATTVVSTLHLQPNPAGNQSDDMVLDGDETCVKLLQLSINGRDLVQGIDYQLAPQQLILKASSIPHSDTGKQKAGGVVLRTVVEIVPGTFFFSVSSRLALVSTRSCFIRMRFLGSYARGRVIAQQCTAIAIV